MELKREAVLFSKRKKEIKSTYFDAFPKEERMPFFFMQIMSLLWNTQFFAFYDGDIFCGMIYLANIGRQTFVMFFAVPKSLRSKGYGSRILSEIQKLHPKNKIIISIEPCDINAKDYAVRVKRKQFYAKNGYKESGYFLKLNGVEQEVIVKNGEFSKWKFIAFFAIYSNCAVFPKVWKNANK